MKKNRLSNVIIAICTAVGFVLGIVYYPIYALAWILHIVARLILAICYFLMFKFRMGADIIKTLFVKHE